MSSAAQTLTALAVVALASVWLVVAAWRKRQQPGCGSEGCSAVTPEIKQLQARLKR